MSKALIIIGSPREDSYGRELTLIYAKHLESSGVHVDIIDLKDFNFDINLNEGYKSELEPSIIEAQEKLKKCNILVLSYPCYWYSYPALFKGFLDKLLWLEVAFSMKNKKILFKGPLRGKKLRIIYTLGGSRLDSKLLAKDGGIRALKGSFYVTGIFSIKVTAIENLNNAKKKNKDIHIKLISKIAKSDIKRLSKI
ncbi:MAG: NAD(P)H-dependent oxidoreductase [Clostridium sp.]